MGDKRRFDVVAQKVNCMRRGRHQQIMALHRYFLWADRMRVHAHALLQSRRGDTTEQLFHHPYFPYWYAGTYVLIEGWRRLKLRDDAVERLLASDNVKHLERHRHAVYHFHPQYFDDKLIGFMMQPDSARWIHALRAAFSRWFLAYFAERKRQTRDR